MGIQSQALESHDDDLTAIKLLTGVSGFLKKTSENTWELTSPTASDIATDESGVSVQEALDAIPVAHTQNTDVTLQKIGGLFLSQEQTVSNEEISLNYNVEALAQVFESVISGKLNRIDLLLRDYSLTGTVGVAIVSTLNGIPEDNILQFEEISKEELSLTSQWISVNFSSPYDLIEGTKYAIILFVNGVGRVYFGIGSQDLNNDVFESSSFDSNLESAPSITATWGSPVSYSSTYKIYIENLTDPADLINSGVLKQDLLVDSLIKIDGRDLSVDGVKLDGIEASSVSLTTIKAESDIASAISLKHTSGSDDQTATTVPTDETGVSVQDKLDSSPNISTGTSAPSSTPFKIGDIYIDTVNKLLYFATGTSSSSDWTAS